jgi:regulator of RNase E activity RraA
MSPAAIPTAATVTTVLLKKHGLRNTAIRGVRASDPSNRRFVGRAVTLRYLPVREASPRASPSLARRP